MWIFVLIALVAGLALTYAGRTWLGWVLPLVLVYAGWWQASVHSPLLFVLSASILALVALVTGLAPLRRAVLTRRLLPLVRPILPRMSETERTAIEAGSVWWEAEFFTGGPDWGRLLRFDPRELSAAEQNFLDGPVERLCSIVHDWDVNEAGDMPPEAWQKLKADGFMGMIIPNEYGGLGFSAAAHSAVVTKLSSRSVAVAVSAMVPNSLGPAELLLHYGTQQQRDHYLPRLATGEEIPAFALTEPGAGSDAGAMQSRGVVERGTFRGKEVVGMRLTWDKRYITLAPVATVLGLAFKLHDPDGLLGGAADLGITCALIPTDLPGIEIGERHDPLGVAFMNGPTHGKDVFVPVDFIIGGRAMAGRGWLMLMQSLAAGRGISLPSMASGAAMLATRTAAAYATVRKQFNLPIAKFEGIEEPLARIGALTYAMDAARVLTAGAVDAGERPSVASAIVKCYLTEGMRRTINDAMDIVGGAGICRGPRNVLAGAYAALPIGITVEGANILTRSMIIFGQGAIRCHPFVQAEMRAAFDDDLVGFDRAFFGHIGFVFRNVARNVVHGLTGGFLAPSPVPGAASPYYRGLTRMSAAFALASDVAMGTLGGALKRKEKITGRLADVLAWMYLASATLKRFHDEGSKARDLPFVRWFCEHALYEAQEAYLGVLRNLPFRPAAWFLRALAFPFGRRFAPPSDRLGHQVAAALVDGGEAREHLTGAMYVPPEDERGLGVLEDALAKVVRAQAVHAKIGEAVEAKRLERKPADTLVERAHAAGIVTDGDRAVIAEAEAARSKAIAVDAFAQRKYAEMSA